jgi:hypothetical protein
MEVFGYGLEMQMKMSSGDPDRHHWTCMIIHGAGGQAAMRRCLGRVMPIFAAVLLVQLLAPIGAFRFVATAVSDPVAVAPLCAAMAAAPGNASDSLPAHDGSCCAICAVGLGNAPVPSAGPHNVVAADRPFRSLAWQPADQPPLGGPRVTGAQARGPPVPVTV